MKPSINKCLEIMDAYGMLDNIKAHCVRVAQVARVIAEGLLNHEVEIDLSLVEAGALLHDIGKTEALNNGGDHVKIGMDICRREGLEELVPIVEEHVRLKSFDPQGKVFEKQIVYYADKRVNHDKIVTLKERLNYILERYANRKPRLRGAIIENFELCKEVERKIFSHLPFAPLDISDLISNHWCPK